MRILVTGGAGFIGSNLVHYLLGPAADELGVSIERVVNLDKLTYAGNPENLAALAGDPRHLFVQGDICDAALLEKLYAEHDFDAVMHLAAESHVDRSIDAPEQFILTNFVGTFQMLHAARNHHKKRQAAGTGDGFRFLHVSTDEVYGSLEPDDPAFSETTPYAPNSPYSASKAGSDHLARAYFHTFHLPVVTTNCSNNYGPRQFPEKLIPLMIAKARRGEKLPVYGDGSNVRDWLYVDDHCRGLTLALLRGTPGEVYNIGGRNELKNIDVVRKLIELVNDCLPEGETRLADDLITYVTDRPGHDRRYAINCEKIERELGWQPKETWETGFKKTVQWYFDNDAWIESIQQGTYQGQRLGADA
ncbi:MAG: dTDP-glucose 4,6-dehydratase [Verrucomicrobiales bacterium]|nr:dTDP-glucose 4,6-dehydratase [Verrucomicrobiales bacterium]